MLDRSSIHRALSSSLIQAFMFEPEAGPSWERANWPIAELDELNLGLDPTAGNDREGQAGGRRARGGCRREPRRSPPGSRRQHPRDDADPDVSGARPSRGRPRSVGPCAAGRTSRPDAGLSRLRRRRSRPADLHRRHAGLRDRDDTPDRGRLQRTTAATSASNICTSTMWRSAVSSSSGWRARTPRSRSLPRASSRSSTKVIQAEQWEKFLARKYVGTKRFGLDGGEGAVPALEAVIKYGGHERRRGN